MANPLPVPVLVMNGRYGNIPLPPPIILDDGGNITDRDSLKSLRLAHDLFHNFNQPFELDNDQFVDEESVISAEKYKLDVLLYRQGQPPNETPAWFHDGLREALHEALQPIEGTVEGLQATVAGMQVTLAGVSSRLDSLIIQGIQVKNMHVSPNHLLEVPFPDGGRPWNKQVQIMENHEPRRIVELQPLNSVNAIENLVYLQRRGYIEGYYGPGVFRQNMSIPDQVRLIMNAVGRYHP